MKALAWRFAGMVGAAIWLAVIAGVAVAPASAARPVAREVSGGSAGERAAAVVAGHVISVAVLDHWMRVQAKTSSAAHPGAPIIVPTDPPRFRRCITQVRVDIPILRRTSRSLLRADCRQLFVSLSRTVLSFLIRSRWYVDEAVIQGIRISHKEVLHAFDRAKRRTFSTGRAFRRFLKQTGQSVADVLFRVRVNLAFMALLKAAGGPSARAVKDLDHVVRKRFRAQTECFRYYVVPLCDEYTHS